MADGARESDRYLGSRYELIERIGAGAMGNVYSAKPRQDSGATKRSRNQASPVLAAKLLRSDLANDPDVVRRFIQERAVLMGLDHPGIVKVVDMVAEGDRLAIVMEFMPGGSLADKLADTGTLAPAQALPLMCATLDALAYAHKQGVLHRDVKPANVLLGAKGLDAPSEAKLSDFGIASFTDERGMHATGLVGSPAYMPPELFTEGTVSAASDVYAAGVMLYELLAGRTPFAGTGTLHTVSYRHVSTEPPKLPVDARLWRVLEGMLAKTPADRLSAAGAADALRQLLPSLTGDEALPIQPEPDWQSVSPSALVKSTPVQAVDAKLDLGQTRLNMPEELQPVTPDSTGKARVIVPSATADAKDVSGTRLGFIERPQDLLDADLPSTKKRPKWLLPVAIVAALAIVIAASIAVVKSGVLSGRGTAPATAPTSWVPAHLTGEPFPTGLRIDLDATPSSSVPGAAELTVAMVAPRSTGLSGDVLLTIPAADSGDCPVADNPSWLPATMSADGVTVACAHKLAITLAAGETQKSTIQVSGNLGDSLSDWLTRVNDQTRQGLSDLTGPVFALQRITGINVEADSLTRKQGSASVSYRVFAQWPGGQQELFRNTTLAFQATDLLKSLTGGSGLDGVAVASCPETQVRGISVLAQQSATSCFVQVTMGDLVSNQGYFSINTSGS